jgi:Domain of unknown function (DUF4282)
MDQSGSTGAPGTPSGSSWTPPPAVKAAGQGFNINDFIAFRYLITPIFMTVIYVIGAIGITLAALGALVGGNAIAGILVFIFGQLYWRIILEFVMVLFRMNDSLQSIDRRGKGM